nr:hypothetical protein Iba_chr15dCG1670 [Ipomoea batatas]
MIGFRFGGLRTMMCIRVNEISEVREHAGPTGRKQTRQEQLIRSTLSVERKSKCARFRIVEDNPIIFVKEAEAILGREEGGRRTPRARPSISRELHSSSHSHGRHGGGREEDFTAFSPGVNAPPPRLSWNFQAAKREKEREFLNMAPIGETDHRTLWDPLSAIAILATAFKVHAFYCQTSWDPLFVIAILATAFEVHAFYCQTFWDPLFVIAILATAFEVHAFYCQTFWDPLFVIAILATAFKVHAFYFQTLWDPLSAITILATACGCHQCYCL